MKRAAGFTLVELMIGIAVLALLMALGVPSFMNLVRNNRLVTQTNEVVTGLNLARSEAIKRGLPVSVCVSSDQTDCDTGTPDWADGWIMFVDQGTAGELDGTDEVLLVGTPVSQGYTLEETEAGAAFMQFLPSGLVNPVAVRRFQLEWAADPTDRTRCVSVAVGGRINTTRGACP